MAAKLRQRNEEEVYKVYMATALQAFSQGKAVGVSYTELTAPKRVDVRSGDDIARDVITACGLKVVL